MFSLSCLHGIIRGWYNIQAVIRRKKFIDYIYRTTATKLLLYLLIFLVIGPTFRYEFSDTITSRVEPGKLATYTGFAGNYTGFARNYTGLDTGRFREIIEEGASGTSIFDFVSITREDVASLDYRELATLRRYRLTRTYTTANPNQTNFGIVLTNPDFDLFARQINNYEVVIFRHVGSACINQIFIVGTIFEKMPVLNTTKLRFSFDGIQFERTPVEILHEGRWPFMAPINKVTSSNSGIGSMQSFCFKNEATISYVMHKPSENIMDTWNKCATWVPCAKHQRCAYFGPECHNMLSVDISVVTLPSKHIGEFFADVVESDALTKQHRKRIVLAGELLSSQNKVKTDDSRMFQRCKSIGNTKYSTLFDYTGAGVIPSWVISAAETRFDTILVTMIFDGVTTVEQVRLSSMFKVTAPPNMQAEFVTALIGVARISKQSWIARFHFPMPFATSAKIIVTNTNGAELLSLCSNITLSDKKKNEAGYFHASELFYANNHEVWKPAVVVTGKRGHLVDFLVRQENINKKVGVPVLFEVRHQSRGEIARDCEADFLGYVDNERSASITSTGFEDFFSMAHVFTGMYGNPQLFFGLSWAENYYSKAPTSLHAYRHFITDPVYFRESLLLIIEGFPSAKKQRAVGMNISNYQNLVLSKKPAISFYSAYYASIKPSKLKLVAELRPDSARIICNGKRQEPSVSTVETEFMFDYITNDSPENVTYYTTPAGCTATYDISFLSSNWPRKLFQERPSYILRREHYMAPYEFSEAISVKMNGKPVGTFNSYVGSVRADQSRRHSDIEFAVMDSDMIQCNLQLYYNTTGRDIAYFLYKVE